MKPLFIFSLPRSGSTLLQRMLMGHTKIASTAEPWLLLPLIYMYREKGTIAEYSHAACYKALDGIGKDTVDGISTYRRAIGEYATSIYSKIAQEDCSYFLDKTPRYFNIIEDIAEIFSDAKFIFLFRNPVQVYASIITTWNEGTFKRIGWSLRDLEDGPVLLSRGFEKLKEQSLAIRYEDLIDEPRMHLQRICRYLDLGYEESMLESFQKKEMKGRMGDSTGVKMYAKVSADGLDKWKKTFSDPFRKRILSRYIGGVPTASLAVQGYDKQNILKEIEELKSRRVIKLRDIYYYLRTRFILKTNVHLLIAKRFSWTKGKYLD